MKRSWKRERVGRQILGHNLWQRSRVMRSRCMVSGNTFIFNIATGMFIATAS